MGLSGEVRSVGQALLRVKEVLAMGFQTVLMPRGNAALLEKEELPQVVIEGIENIKQAIQIIF